MTSNEIQPLTEGDIVPAGAGFANTPDASPAISTLMEHAKAMEVAFQLADAMCNTALVPQIYRGKPQDGTAAILYGAELGLNPIQSLQQIFVVHGTPAIYARTMVALVKVKGYVIETVESTNESVTVRGSNPRTGVVEESTWTLERATQAGYVPTIDEKTGKFATNANGKLIGNEKYLKDPQAMLYAKAAAEVCRKLAPEVLLGISRTTEELELEQPPIQATVQRVPARAKGVAGVGEALGLTAPDSNPVAEPEPAQVSASDPVEKVDAAPEVAMATPAQQKRVGELLAIEKLDTRKQKLDYLEGQFGRKFTSPANLTAAEADQLIGFLSEAQAADAAKAAEQ